MLIEGAAVAVATEATVSGESGVAPSGASAGIVVWISGTLVGGTVVGAAAD